MKKPRIAAGLNGGGGGNRILRNCGEITYIDDPRLAIDTNLAENAIRPFALERRNWLLSDTVMGAKASAALYSLTATAKANGLEPYAYLRHLFAQLPKAKTGADFEALLPFKSVLARAHAEAA